MGGKVNIPNIDDKRIGPEDFLVLTEIVKGTRLKYEIDPETGLLELDRVLNTSLRFPGNYGFIPNTLSEDGDPLDVFIIMEEEVLPMTLVRCAPIGVIEMIDNGERDEKILAVPLHKKGRYANTPKDLKEIPEGTVNEIMHFLRVYKDLEKANKVEINGLHGRAEAIKIIKEAKARFLKP